ncbi:DUF5131 family protein [Terasakiella sp.]|uniref:DUF5131 family protein n=1 Tax=Terasakiella sp. TaxID=2034861 RepID=UPI003AA82454
MFNKTKITWAEKTWNVAVGCDQVTPECDHCYAMLDANRRFGSDRFPMYEGVLNKDPHNTGGPIKAKTGKHYQWSGRVNVNFNKIKEISKLPTNAVVFLNSMSDTFHAQIPDEFLIALFKAMNARPDVVFQVLTKRTARMARLTQKLGLEWTDNIWAGTTVGCKESLYRLDWLSKVPAKKRFVSAEPLLHEMDYRKWLADGTINWLIVGGESKSGWRPMSLNWVRTIRDDCKEFGVPFFFKQEAGYAPKKHPELDGVIHEEYPPMPWD